jgi:hypothetical protein
MPLLPRNRVDRDPEPIERRDDFDALPVPAWPAHDSAQDWRGCAEADVLCAAFGLHRICPHAEALAAWVDE